MNSKELVRATLAGLPVPRVAVGPLAVHFCAHMAGYSLRQYTTSAEALADSIVCYYERFRPDAVWISADTWVSAEAMGEKVSALGEDQPFGGMGEPLVQTTADLDRIPPPDVEGQGRYPLMLEALRRVVARLGEEVFIVGCFDQYPFSLAAALMGLERIMTKVVDDPTFVRAVMTRCEEYALEYGKALSNAGADLLSGGDSPAGLLGPKLYEEIAFPFEQSLVRFMKAATGKPVSLHICGDSSPVLPLMGRSGADVLEIDHLVDLRTASRLVDSSITLWGNLDPVSLLSQGSPDQVSAKARRVLEEARSLGRRSFVLSSGCTLAVETPAANLHVLISSVSSGSVAC